MSIQEMSINTIKKLGLEMISRADSGHCGATLDLASILYAVYHEANVCVSDPQWLNRDRIVVSCGYASAGLYSILHLMGYAIRIDDLKDFRVLGSITPGHPEINTPGVDCTTGALGQGLATSVGLAIAENMLASRYNTRDYDIIDHYTYCICGDGDLMEGLSYESCALAGRQKLNKLIVLYNKNNITIDGSIDMVAREDVRGRFEAQGFLVLECSNDYKEIIACIKKAKTLSRPTLIVCNTKIAQGTAYEGNTLAHANPFSQKDIIKLCQKWGLDTTPFVVDIDVYKHFKQLSDKKSAAYLEWQTKLTKYKKGHAKSYKQLFNEDYSQFVDYANIRFTRDISTVEASHKVLNKLYKIPNLVGGCADVSKSTRAFFDDGKYYYPKNPTARNIMYGVRENAMCSITNGIVLHGGMRAFDSTFLAFSSYMMYGLRLSSMMKLPALHILTHDSISLGQDGPSHQPVMELESLRLMPGIRVFRPADANETKFAYMWYLANDMPTVLALSKVEMPLLKMTFGDVAKGGYILAKEIGKSCDVVLVATGSEVDIALRTKKLLEYKGYNARVVSVPCRELFERQDPRYIQKVIGGGKVLITLEAGITHGWSKILGGRGVSLGVNTFGESATKEELYDLFGLSAMNVCNVAIDLLKNR